MVERLKAAIEKARERRGAATPVPASGGAPRPGVGAAAPQRWLELAEAKIDARRMDARRVVAYGRRGPAAIAFDLLRTRLLRACHDNGWTRIGVTSPTKGCGKTLTCANLAFSLARTPRTRVIVIDSDMRAPALATTLGVRTEKRIEAFYTGRVSHMDFLERVGETLAFGLNGARVGSSAELLQTPEAAAALQNMREDLRPTLVLHDLPPMLVTDDAIGFLRSLDAVLLIAGAGRTQAGEIESCERLIGDAAPFLGVVLNKVREPNAEGAYYDESYGYGAQPAEA